MKPSHDCTECMPVQTHLCTHSTRVVQWINVSLKHINNNNNSWQILLTSQRYLNTHAEASSIILLLASRAMHFAYYNVSASITQMSVANTIHSLTTINLVGMILSVFDDATECLHSKRVTERFRFKRISSDLLS